MRKWVQNYVLFILLFLGALFQAVNGFLLWLVIPSEGYQGGRNQAYGTEPFIWAKDTWIDLHDWTAVALVVLIVIHLILHWRWLTVTTRKFFTGQIS